VFYAYERSSGHFVVCKVKGQHPNTVVGILHLSRTVVHGSKNETVHFVAGSSNVSHEYRACNIEPLQVDILGFT